MKPKKCRVCQTEYTPARMGQKVCSPGCAIQDVQKTKLREYRKETRELKEKIKTTAQRKTAAQNAVNRYVKARDRLRFLSQGKRPECISCGNTNPAIQYCAGHYKTRGAHPELALDPKNIHLQCNKRCNEQLSGNINGDKTTRGYNAGIVAWYGEDEGSQLIEYLTKYHPPKNYTHEDLEEIRKKYNKLALECEKMILKC